MKKIEYIDLGLPSSTLWATHNAHIGKKYYFTYDEAVDRFGDCMPNYDQYKELLNLCKWEWTKLFDDKVRGYRVTGLNGNSIFLPASGYFSNTPWNGRGLYGHYWSADAYNLYLDRSFHYLYDTGKHYGFSVRTVKTKCS